MIQRIQSLYLLISSAICTILIFSPLASFRQGDQIAAELFSYGVKKVGNADLLISYNPVILVVLVTISAMLGIFTIFQYKKRPLQVLLSTFNIIILLVMLGMMVYYCIVISQGLNGSINYYIQAIFPFISIILLFLAIKSIRKDEKLIRSVDRIR